jgi:hypothetical protein
MLNEMPYLCNATLSDFTTSMCSTASTWHQHITVALAAIEPEY